MTQAGIILGTAAYMSPEQARGKVVDKRADVWAFGVVLFEMLSGRRAYAGTEVSDVLASVLKDTLPLDAVPAATPAPIRRLLRRCLEKDRADRLDSMATARLEIADAMTPAKDEASVATTVVPANRRRTMLMTAAAVVAASALTGLIVWRARTPESPQPVALVLAPPRGEPVRINVNQPGVAISHDGRRIAYSHGEVGSTIVVKALDQFADTALANLGEQPRSPFFSPNDQWLGYFTASSIGEGGRLMKVAPTGGTPLEIGPVVGNLRGASWGRDNTIVFGSTATSGLLRVSAAGGQPEVLTQPDGPAGEVDHLWPALMPDGKHVVFTVDRRPTDGIFQIVRDIAVLDLATRKWRVIKAGGSYPRFVTTGHLLFATDQGLYAAPFDPVACEFRGEAVRVIADVASKPTSGAADVDVSDAGTLTFIAGTSLLRRTLAWVERSGTVTPIPAPQNAYQGFLLSPDRTRAVVTVNVEGAFNLHVYDLARGSLTRITPPTRFGVNPVWSSDGRSVYYRGGAAGQLGGIYRVSAAGAGSPELLLESKAGDSMTPTSATPDGRSILTSINVAGKSEIQILNLEGTPSLKRLVADTDPSTNGHVSPDGRWLAYVVRTGAGGASEVFVRPFPNVNGDRLQVSIGGGTAPVWAWDSRAIFYSSQGRSGLWRVDMASNGQLGKPVLFLANDPSIEATDIATGGDRVLRIQSINSGKGNELRVVLNWFEQLKQTMAAAK